VRQALLNLDDAWPVSSLPDGEVEFDLVDLRQWGPRLRYHGTRWEVDAFYASIRDRLTPFVLYGSGDFHYLAGVLLRRIDVPVTVVSFDNHPDWDIRPPHWACGGWVNRALEMPHVRRVSVWGCGNFELAFPSRLFANHKAVRSGRLEVHAWAERQKPAVQRRFNCMTRENWRKRFESFTTSLAWRDVYVTVDLDCLTVEEAATNWENGLFTAADVAWALGRLRDKSFLVAGDLCGSYSQPTYARPFQRFAGNWDHPRLPILNPQAAARVNAAALAVIWPALVGASALPKNPMAPMP
jgi:arginase family enzyme